VNARQHGKEINGETGLRDADRVYAELRRRILTLDLDPGATLDESAIVRDMGTSRTPVREAIIRLVSEKLLRRDGRQIRISSFEVNQLRAFFEGMTLLSRAIHHMAATRRTALQLARIKEALVAFDNAVAAENELQINEANHAFHVAIAEAADSEFIHRAYEEMLVESLRLAGQCFSAGSHSVTARNEHLALISADHRAIFSAIERRDAAEADRIATQHSMLFRERLSKQILGPSNEIDSIPLS
jgi:DNA-binding GntR family transcriptional regulator